MRSMFTLTVSRRVSAVAGRTCGRTASQASARAITATRNLVTESDLGFMVLPPLCDPWPAIGEASGSRTG